MRLIDADALMERAERQCDLGCEYPKTYRDAMCRACPAGNVMDMIEEAPTVDAEPVRHGRWVYVADHGQPRYKCSKCGGNHFDLSLGLDSCYCGRCGAKMDKEDNE